MATRGAKGLRLGETLADPLLKKEVCQKPLQTSVLFLQILRPTSLFKIETAAPLMPLCISLNADIPSWPKQKNLHRIPATTLKAIGISRPPSEAYCWAACSTALRIRC